MVSKYKKYIVIIFLLVVVGFFVKFQLTLVGCLSCDYMDGVKNSKRACNISCGYAPRWKVTLFDLTGYKAK